MIYLHDDDSDSKVILISRHCLIAGLMSPFDRLISKNRVNILFLYYLSFYWTYHEKIKICFCILAIFFWKSISRFISSYSWADRRTDKKLIKVISFLEDSSQNCKFSLVLNILTKIIYKEWLIFNYISKLTFSFDHRVPPRIESKQYWQSRGDLFSLLS